MTSKNEIIRRKKVRNNYYKIDFYEIGEDAEYSVHQFNEYHVRYTDLRSQKLVIDFWPGSNKFYVVKGHRCVSHVKGNTDDLLTKLIEIRREYQKYSN